MALQSQQPVLVHTTWDSTGYQSDTVLSAQHYTFLHRRTPSDPTLFATPQSPGEPSSPRVSTDGSIASAGIDEGAEDQTLDNDGNVTLVKQYEGREARRGLFSFRQRKSKDTGSKDPESLPSKSKRKLAQETAKQQLPSQEGDRKPQDRNGDVANASWFRRTFSKDSRKAAPTPAPKLTYDKDDVPLLDGSPIPPGCFPLLYKPKTKETKESKDGAVPLDGSSTEQHSDSLKSVEAAESTGEVAETSRSDGGSEKAENALEPDQPEDGGSSETPPGTEAPAEVEADKDEEKSKRTHRRHRSLTSLLPKIGFKRAVEPDADGTESSAGSEKADTGVNGVTKPVSPSNVDAEAATDKSSSTSATLLCFGKPAVVEGDGEETPPMPTASGREDSTKFPLGVVGLKNLGNTCFINAALQCLRFTPGLASYLVDNLALEVQNVSDSIADTVEPQSTPAADNGLREDAGPSDSALESVSSASSGSSLSVQDNVVTENQPAIPLEASTGNTNKIEPSINVDEAAVAVSSPGGSSADAEPPSASLAETATDTPQREETQTPQEQLAAGTNSSSPSSSPLPPAKGQLAAVFRQLVRDLYAQSDTAVVDPSALFKLLSSLPAGADFCDGGQHDCQEVLRVILDGLHADLNEGSSETGSQGSTDGSTQDSSEQIEAETAKADRVWRQYKARDNSLITDLFGGQLQSSVHCHKCNTRFTTYEPFWDLSLPLAKESKGGGLSWFSAKAPATIQDCMQLFAADELLQGNESFFCDRCNERTSATKKLRIHRFPKVLVLHIKRFKYASNTREKLTANVSFPLKDLKLRQFASEECSLEDSTASYELYGVSNHYGNMVGGHYTSACKVKLEGGKEQWYSFSDDVVMKTTPGAVVGNTAYILFYCRQDWAQKAHVD